MSRSEHATRRDPRDPGDLERKRRIKWFIEEERARPRGTQPDANALGVAIATWDEGPYVHYPASADDLRAILARVPSRTAEGLGRIELCLDRTPRDDGDVDPFVGFLTNEVLPGVYGSPILGTYYHGTRSDIRLHGYVFDPAMRDRAIVEVFLRLQMLATFVHELGHHRDRRERTARGRWRADDRDECELQAEAIEYAWTRDHVIPYLEETYPEQVAELERWLARHGGVALPLATLIGDPRSNGGETGEQRFFSVRSAFASLFGDVQAHQPPTETRVSFARELHYGTHYDEALAVLDQVSRDAPEDASARVLRADIYVHQERHAEAEPVVMAVVERTPDDTDALEVLADVLRARGAWSQLRAVAGRLSALLEHGDWRWCSSSELEIHALLELEELDAAETTLQVVLAATTGGPIAQSRVRVLEALVRLRQQRYTDALAVVAALPPRFRRAERVAITFEASHHLGLPCDVDAVLGVLAQLRGMGHVAWTERLRVLTGAVLPAP